MSLLTVVFSFVLIVLFAFVMPIVIYTIRAQHKKKMAELVSGNEQVEAQALEMELVSVKERLAVLERIVTDGRYDLDQEFRRLESVKQPVDLTTKIRR